jgi:hypothetical protein
VEFQELGLALTLAIGAVGLVSAVLMALNAWRLARDGWGWGDGRSVPFTCAVAAVAFLGGWIIFDIAWVLYRLGRRRFHPARTPQVSDR